MGHLHHEGFSPYTGEFPDLPFLLVVTARFPDAGARTGKSEVDGSAPPFCCPERARGRCAIHICATPPGGALPSKLSLAGRPRMIPVMGKRGRVNALDIHEERLETLGKQVTERLRARRAPAALTAVQTAAIGASRETAPAAMKPARLSLGHPHALRSNQCRMWKPPGGTGAGYTA